jgi:hypothetical protein
MASKKTRKVQPRATARTTTASGAFRSSGEIYQFKITLEGAEPPIWRRIQVPDCTLAALHEQIQAAMGWSNAHLSQFEIEGVRYGDPEFLDDPFGGMRCEDSTTTLLSQIVPRDDKPFAFTYEYDFGDSWLHEVLFEGRPAVEAGKQYPLCLEGARACPPEDVGGAWGYAEFLEQIADRKHADDEELIEWARENFDPEAFDAQATTNNMRLRRRDRGSMR